MADVQKTIELPARPEEVWDALTNAKKISAWLGCEARLKNHQPGALHPGDSFEYHWDEEWTATAEIVRLEPGVRLVTTWEWEGDDEETEVEYRLDATPTGTRLTLFHRGFEEEETAEDHGDNWESYLQNLPKIVRRK